MTDVEELDIDNMNSTSMKLDMHNYSKQFEIIQEEVEDEQMNDVDLEKTGD